MEKCAISKRQWMKYSAIKSKATGFVYIQGSPYHNV